MGKFNRTVIMVVYCEVLTVRAINKMKRLGNLKHIWCNYETLMLAYNEVRKSKTFYPVFLRYENNLATNLNNLLSKLEQGTYKPQKPREFYVYEPKKRLIHAPQLEDRIVQHAVLIAVRETIENRFIHHSFACRKDRGTHKASAVLKKWLVNYKDEGYYLKIDITKFFYSIDHNALIKQLGKFIKCKPTMELMKMFINNDEGKGLPLGNVTSQIFANLALNIIDHFIKRELKIKHYIRYMDDSILLSKSKEILKEALKRITELIYKINLKINSKTVIDKIVNGIDFVGCKTWYNRKVIRKRTLFNVKRKLKKNADMQRISSFLSHSMQTESIVYVTKKILEVTGKEFEQFIKTWILNNRKDKYNEIFQM